MRILTDELPADVTPWPPETPPRGAETEVDARAQHSLARRALERFGLIAFGLYHVPLFLNNYPSLGGGGFDDNGLSAAWGRVFTPPGVWVARHVFHMTGPMPSAQLGDNGDVGEEFGRLLLSVVIAILGAAVWTFADRRRPRGRWVSPALHTMLRYAIALGLTGYAIAKLLPMQFPPIRPITLEQRVGDLSPMSLLWTFMQYSRPYAFFGGVMEMLVVVLLCFRRTAMLGALVCLAVMTNVALMNLAYGVPVKLYSLVIVASAGVLLLYDVPRLWAVFLRNGAFTPAPLPALFQDRIPSGLRWSIKVALVGSVIVSSVVTMQSAIDARQASSPLDGAWVVTLFDTRGQSRDSVTPAPWQRLFVQGNGMMIRSASESPLRCRTNTPNASTIALTCAKAAGDFRWTRTGDTLRLDGVFDGAHVTALARHANPSDYPLLRSRFRWISDR